MRAQLADLATVNGQLRRGPGTRRDLRRQLVVQGLQQLAYLETNGALARQDDGAEGE